MLFGSAYYFPSIPIGKYKTLVKEHPEMFFWTEDALYKHPRILCSYALVGDILDLRRVMRISQDVTVMIDSGGFQYLTSKSVNDPHDVIEYENRNADIGVCLDYPPYTDVSKKNVSEFDKCLNLSVQSYRVCLDNRVERILLYAPIHGIGQDSFQKWFDRVREIGDFDGYCFSLSASRGKDIVLEAVKILMRNRVDKNVHFFIGGELTTYILVSRLAKVYPGLVSVDMASNELLGGMSKFMFGFDKALNIGDKYLNIKPYCGCPFCTSEVVRKCNMDDYRNYYVSMHNVWFMSNKYAFLDSISGEDYDTLAYLGVDVKYVEKLDILLGGKDVVTLDGVLKWTRS